MNAVLRALLRPLAAGLPSSCALCGIHGDAAICDGCARQFFALRAARCARCGLALPNSADACGACLRHPPAFDATVVAADYAPPLDELAQALKFNSRLALAPLFARLLREAWLLAPHSGDALPALLCPVPLSAARLAERGFNQALEIARPLARALGIALDPRLCLRLRETRAQSLLPIEERRQNVRGAFAPALHAADTVRGRHIGLVDDVMTTGATLHELAATLKRYGAARITNFVFARTPNPGDRPCFT